MQTVREPVVGSSPYPFDFAWRQVQELDGSTGLLVSLVAGSMLCMATLLLWLVLAPFHPIRIDYATLLAGAILVLVLHELAHAVAFSCGRARGVRVECAWLRHRPQLRYRGAVSRAHYLGVLVAPIVVVSLLPIAVSASLSLHSGDLVLVSMLNALVSGGDATAAALLVLQVPRRACVERRGDRVVWKPLAA
jgi:hypothetical protein